MFLFFFVRKFDKRLSNFIIKSARKKLYVNGGLKMSLLINMIWVAFPNMFVYQSLRFQ